MIGKGKAVIVEDPEEKLRALEILMKHQTGKDFSEFRENPRLERTVGILKVESEVYTCKSMSRQNKYNRQVKENCKICQLNALICESNMV